MYNFDENQNLDEILNEISEYREDERISQNQKGNVDKISFVQWMSFCSPITTRNISLGGVLYYLFQSNVF